MNLFKNFKNSIGNTQFSTATQSYVSLIQGLRLHDPILTLSDSYADQIIKNFNSTARSQIDYFENGYVISNVPMTPSQFLRFKLDVPGDILGVIFDFVGRES